MSNGGKPKKLACDCKVLERARNSELRVLCGMASHLVMADMLTDHQTQRLIEIDEGLLSVYDEVDSREVSAVLEIREVLGAMVDSEGA